MSREELQSLAETARRILNERKAIALVKWASLEEGRAEKIERFLLETPNISDAQLNYEMARIVLAEVL